MNGHQQLLAMRAAGKEPTAVYLTDSNDAYACATAASWHMHPHCHTGEFFAHIRIDRTDLPEDLDLRCIRGLMCHIASDHGDARFLRLFQACVDAGASAVAGLSEGQVHVFKPTATEN
jgi:hypothetical protein